ncbi:MAG: hypothetical protein KatS3mg105_3586 [Gemmatales bacterium]|nr:MAG: hypothetical protein KatS3mg105_3586 [Gemmatales bacterium]
MSLPATPPGRSYYLLVTSVSFGTLFACMGGILFGVQLEVVAPARGTITARDMQDIRTPVAGLVQPGWYEGELAQASSGQKERFRVDSQGNGIAEAHRGKGLAIHAYQVEDGRRIDPNTCHFHRLSVGDILWPGQVLAEVSSLAGNKEPKVLLVPESAPCWVTVKVKRQMGQAVDAGGAVATIVPVDRINHQVIGAIARLEVEERHFGAIHPEQRVRLRSRMFNHRVYGEAEAKVEQLEPLGEECEPGKRRFFVVAPILRSPFPLVLGSSFDAEIVVGRKSVYRVILEH